jgi:hypothetical protein
MDATKPVWSGIDEWDRDTARDCMFGLHPWGSCPLCWEDFEDAELQVAKAVAETRRLDLLGFVLALILVLLAVAAFGYQAVRT